MSETAERYKPRVHQTTFDLEKDPDRANIGAQKQTDINRILDKVKKTGVVTHIRQHGGHYGDFVDFDFESAQIALARANSIFYALEPNTRAEFGNQPSAFFKFVNDPANKDRLVEVLPELAEPGKQLPDVIGGQVGEQIVAAVQEALSTRAESGGEAEAGASSGETA